MPAKLKEKLLPTAKKLLPAPEVVVDYPKQDELVSSARYAIRISALKDAKSVEVAVDQGPWQPCRQAVGHWWYDWSGYENGEHEVVARSKTREGKCTLSDAHEFLVKIK